MLEEPIKNLKKPSFSGHETFPLRYGWLTKMMDYFNPNQPTAKTMEKTKQFFGNGEQKSKLMTNFGVGKNMVSSIKFWSEKVNIIDKKQEHGMKLSPLGEIIYKYDRYLDYPSTLWLLHWKLCSNVQQTTTFYYAFNCYASLTITKEQLLTSLKQLVKSKGWLESSEKSIQRDIDIFFRTYTISKNKNNEIAEDTFECPLAELGIIQLSAIPQTYQFVIGEKSSLNNFIFAYALNEFWDHHYKDAPTIGIDKITYGTGSPGRIFRIDELAISKRLSELEHLTNGYFKWTETAGLYQLLRDQSKNFRSQDFLELAYRPPPKKKARAA